MRVDLYTDAGCKGGVGVWAAVAYPEGREPFERNGRLREWLIDSTIAEMQAMANGLHAALKASVIQRGDSVRIICDNRTAVHLLNGGARAKSTKQAKWEAYTAALRKIRAIAEQGGVAHLRGGQVKAHQRLSSKDPHAPGNRRADALCRAAYLEGSQ